MSAPQVLPLSGVSPHELEALWLYEERLWRERLRWDISNAIGSLRRAAERGSLPGCALRQNGRIAAYACYTLVGPLAVISRFTGLAGCSVEGLGMLLEETLARIHMARVRRIECQFAVFDISRLPEIFTRHGFHIFWRVFMLHQLKFPRPASPSLTLQLDPLERTQLDRAAAIMFDAYNGSVDAESSEQYRTREGCELMLEDILDQGGAGNLIAPASAIARHRRNAVGFVIVTEVAGRQGHLAQIAVLPQFQGQGIGRRLVEHSLMRLAELGFEAISLIVSRANRRAYNLYQAVGFKPALSFPVFSRDEPA